jgi:hypothetical protein
MTHGYSTKITFGGGAFEYDLTGGLRSITRTINRDVMTYGIDGEENMLNRTPFGNSDIVRIDITLANGNQGDNSTQPCLPYINYISIANRLKEETVANITNSITFGEPEVTLYGLWKNMTLTQRMGEGDMWDMSLTFEVGTVVEPSS